MPSHITVQWTPELVRYVLSCQQRNFNPSAIALLVNRRYQVFTGGQVTENDVICLLAHINATRRKILGRRPSRLLWVPSRRTTARRLVNGKAQGDAVITDAKGAAAQVVKPTEQPQHSDHEAIANIEVHEVKTHKVKTPKVETHEVKTATMQPQGRQSQELKVQESNVKTRDWALIEEEPDWEMI
ncbi:hypothetical protein GE09DRAFT_1272760 [Coniochaeta sp. 2T2.1]|nr:hypothetical protein GE09DRAFT_1272760 [Coniochaeta sp. 2T2.1]